MADITVDGIISTSTARGMRSIVFTTDQIGYHFYAESATFVYSKTTDGGATWGAPVTIYAWTPVAFDVWFDRWTPGDTTGTLIHLWYFDVTADDVLYRTLDTATDTIGTQRVVFAGATAVAGRGVFVSGTKTRSGYLYCAYDIDAGAEKGLHRSVDGGSTWSANLSTTFVEATIDQCLLFPASNSGDNNDCWALYHDADVDALTLKMWDSSAAAQVESATIMTLAEGVTDLVHQYGFSASVRHSDGHLIVVGCDAYDVGTDTKVYDITGTSTITAKTQIVTNLDDHYHPQVFINQNNNDIYVAYNGKRDGSEVIGTTTKVYYVKSTDGGTNWSSGDTAYMEGAAGVVVQVYAPLMGPRFFVSWRVGTTLIGNAVNSLAFGGATPIALAVASTFAVALGIVVARNRSLAAASAFTPALTKSAAFARTIAITSTFTAALTRSAAFSRALAATSAFTASITRSLGFSRSLPVSSSFAASLVAARTLLRNLDVTSTFAAALAGSTIYSRSLSVTSPFTAAIARVVTFYRTLAVGSTFAPSLMRSAAFQRALAVASTFTATLTKSTAFQRTLAVASPFTAALSRGIGKVMAVGSLFTVALTTSKTYFRTLAATTTMTPLMTRLLGFARALAVTSTFAPSLARQALFARTLAVASTFTASLARNVAWRRTLAITSTFAAALSRSTVFARALGVASAFVPALAKSTIRQVILSVSALFTAALQWLRSGLDTAALTGATRIYPKLTGATRAYTKLTGEARAHVRLTGSVVAYTALEGEMRAGPRMTGEIRTYPRAA